MNKIDVNHLRWLVSKYLSALGLWGLLGVAIIVSCLLIYVTYIMELDEQVTLTQSKLKQLSQTPIKLATLPKTQIQTTAQDVTKFYDLFPAGASLPKWLSMMDAMAIKRHLILNRGDYKLSQTKQGELLRYEIVFPVVGQYIQIRQFIADVLLKLPALALNDLQIKRENSLSPTVEARLVFVLFLKGDSW